MQSSSVTYFASPGKQNTDATLDAVVGKMQGSGIRHVVVASSSGDTAQKLVSKLSGRDVNIVVVTSHCGFEEKGECEMSDEVFDELVKNGVRVVRASHVLSGLERSISRKLGGASRVEAIAETLRALFGQGMKVCVEIAVMAADNGAVPCDGTEVIVVAGTGYGADTACVMVPSHANSFFDTRVLEILAIPAGRR